MKEKMLYVSHVDWRWIKQRPHFLAEGLMPFFNVSVLYFFQYKNRKNLQKRNLSGQNILPVFYIPMCNRIKLLGALNKSFVKLQFALQIKRANPKYIYLTYPTQCEFIPKSYSGSIIYDCMDDHIAMVPDNQKLLIQKSEHNLFSRANIVLVSSINLRNVLLNRYGKEHDGKMILVRNGYGGKILDAEPKVQSTGDIFTISYIGTVGKWFNFDYILKSLDEIPNLQYQIIGPVEVEKPKHDRLQFIGTLEHSKLYDAVKNTDCLTMPFQLNDIVVSVDPVKLYEYINFNMNILTIKYPEIDRFAPFVHFYENYDGFIRQIKSMMADNTIKYDNGARTKFLQENNWESRVNLIVEALLRNQTQKTKNI